MLINNIAITVLSASLALCIYLLTVLGDLRHIHHLSRAWRFIFLGLSLLTIECAIGIHLAYLHKQPLTLEQTGFLCIIFVKSLCYAVGFTIWKHDLQFSFVRHKETLTMKDEMDENTGHEHSGEPVGNPPNHPTPPAKPTPAPGPQPDDPGVPEDPGK